MLIRTNSDFVETSWSGGKTIQLAIYPANASLQNRDFEWRISTAFVDVDESEFSDFSGYSRLFIPLSSEVKLKHFIAGNVQEILLKANQVHFFDGSWKTIAYGKVQDFNLIYKNGNSPKVLAANYYSGDRFSCDFIPNGCFLVNGRIKIEGYELIGPCFLSSNHLIIDKWIVLSEIQIVFIQMNGLK